MAEDSDAIPPSPTETGNDATPFVSDAPSIGIDYVPTTASSIREETPRRALIRTHPTMANIAGILRNNQNNPMLESEIRAADIRQAPDKDAAGSNLRISRKPVPPPTQGRTTMATDSSVPNSYQPPICRQPVTNGLSSILPGEDPLGEGYLLPLLPPPIVVDRIPRSRTMTQISPTSRDGHYQPIPHLHNNPPQYQWRYPETRQSPIRRSPILPPPSSSTQSIASPQEPQPSEPRGSRLPPQYFDEMDYFTENMHGRETNQATSNAPQNTIKKTRSLWSLKSWKSKSQLSSIYPAGNQASSKPSQPSQLRHGTLADSPEATGDEVMFEVHKTRPLNKKKSFLDTMGGWLKGGASKPQTHKTGVQKPVISRPMPRTLQNIGGDNRIGQGLRERPHAPNRRTEDIRNSMDDLEDTLVGDQDAS